MHVFSWTSGGGMVDLGTPPGTENVLLRAADGFGQLAGSAGAEDQHAFLWDPRAWDVDFGTPPDLQ
jgi:hypothetical protein